MCTAFAIYIEAGLSESSRHGLRRCARNQKAYVDDRLSEAPRNRGRVSSTYSSYSSLELGG